MATSTKTKAAPAPAPAPATEPQGEAADALNTVAAGDAPGADAPPAPKPGPNAYQSVWVYRTGVALAKKQTGFVWALKADAAAMIAAGDAVDPYTTYPLPYITATPAPPVGPVVVTFDAFSAATPSVASLTQADAAKIKVGDKLLLAQTAGDALAQVDGKTGTVASKTSNTATLTGISLDGLTFTGVKASGTVQAPAPAPAEPPAPAPAPAPEPEPEQQPEQQPEGSGADPEQQPANG